MARPKKPADKIRATILRVRVTLAEKGMLEALAKEEGLSLSDWIRVKAIGAKPLLKGPNPMQETLLRLLAAYGAIGNNCNQIARALNRRDEHREYEVPVHFIVEVMTDIKAITQQLRDTLAHGP